MQGCKLLAAAFQAVPKQDNLNLYLRELGQAYWDFSRNHTSYYMVMFGGAFSEFKPEEESLHAIFTALQQVIALITEAIEQGFINEKDPLLVVNLVWASLHGVIHLHLGGHIQNEETAKILYDRSVSNLIHTFFKKISNSKSLFASPSSTNLSRNLGISFDHGFFNIIKNTKKTAFLPFLHL